MSFLSPSHDLTQKRTMRSWPGRSLARLLGGAAVGALAVCALLPLGRDLLVQQTTLAVGSTRYLAPPAPTEIMRRAEAAPDDLSLQMGAVGFLREWSWRNMLDFHRRSRESKAASIENRERFLSQQAARWQGNPAFDALVIGENIEWKVSLHRIESAGNGLTTSRPYRGQPGKPTSPETLAAFDAVAHDGEMAEPSNALFPLMRSLVSLEAHRDAEAITQLEKAAACPFWREPGDIASEAMSAFYQREHPEVTELGIRRYADHFFGRLQLVWIGRSLDAYAATMLAFAVKAERAGDLATGMRIRRAMIDCGTKMVRGGTDPTNGEIMCDTALLCPGGAPPNPHAGISHQGGVIIVMVDVPAFRRTRWTAWEEYLRSRGLDEQAERDEALFQSQIAQRNGMRRTSRDNAYACESLLYLWGTAVLLLDNALWTLLLGAIALLAAAAYRRTGRRAAVGIAAILTAIGGLSLLACQLASLRYLANGPFGGGLWDGRFHGIRLGWFIPTPVVIPLLLTAVIACVALTRRRRGQSFSAARCWAGAAIPIAAVLILVYALAVLPTTIRTERALALGLTKEVQSELP